MTKKQAIDEIWTHYGCKPPYIPKKFPAPQRLPKTDCFAFNEKAKNGCAALSQCWCQWEDCNFFKTSEEYKKGLKDNDYLRIN